MCSRNSQGSSLAELAAALIIVLPVLIAVLFVTIEGAQAYLLKNALNDASRQAARDLAKAYSQDEQIANDRSLQNSMVLNKIRIPNCVINSQQFSVDFNAEKEPQVVAVTATYEGGKLGLPAFPTLDLLRLGANKRIACQSVYRLE